MNNKRTSVGGRVLGVFLVLALLASCSSRSSDREPPVKTTSTSAKWERDRAWDWYGEQEWLVGANFNPSTAINQLEMWQKDSFDPETIDRELGWAQGIGMNAMRVYLHDLLYEQDSAGFLDRMDQFLTIADDHNMKILFVIFDSCWDPFPKTGKQRDPKPHVHNSGWVQSPGYYALKDSTQYPRLKRYVQGVIGHYARDTRVLGWDIWNEPDNDTGPSYRDVDLPDKEEYVLPLLDKAFSWAREMHPEQPLTSAVWLGDWSRHDDLHAIARLQLERSDIITFHNYDDPGSFEQRIKWLQRYERPIICTEYMARPNGSTFEGFLPIAKKYNVGMFNWGLVDGKTQTKYPWDSWTREYTSEPDVWFHEVFRNNGESYRLEETQLIKRLTNRG